jgi:hypothetical protein
VLGPRPDEPVRELSLEALSQALSDVQGRPRREAATLLRPLEPRGRTGISGAIIRELLRSLTARPSAADLATLIAICDRDPVSRLRVLRAIRDLERDCRTWLGHHARRLLRDHPTETTQRSGRGGRGCCGSRVAPLRESLLQGVFGL